MKKEILSKGFLLSVAEMGIVIDKWEEDENGIPTVVYISVPEHSEEKFQDKKGAKLSGQELAGETLAQQFKAILQLLSRTRNPIKVMSKTRVGEYWTKEKAQKAIQKMAKQINVDPNIL